MEQKRIVAMTEEELSKITFWEAVALTDIQKTNLKEKHGKLLLSGGLKKSNRNNSRGNIARTVPITRRGGVGRAGLKVGSHPSTRWPSSSATVPPSFERGFHGAADALGLHGWRVPPSRVHASSAHGGRLPVGPKSEDCQALAANDAGLPRRGRAGEGIDSPGLHMRRLQDAGVAAEQAKEAGFTARDCKEAGYTALELFDLCQVNHLHRTEKPGEQSDVAGFADGKGFRVAVPRGGVVKIRDAIPNNGDEECVIAALYGWAGKALDAVEVGAGTVDGNFLVQPPVPAVYVDVTEAVKGQVRAANGDSEREIVAMDEALGAAFPVDATFKFLDVDDKCFVDRKYDTWRAS